MFRADNKLWEAYYEVGATEYQDGYDEDLECVEVEAYEKTVTDYRKKA